MLKKLLTPFFLLFLICNTTAQNIQNISYQPPYPGPLDSVTVYVDLVFTSGDCALEYESHTISGDTIRINVHHCPGALTVICDVTDTVQLGTLASGTYYTEVVVLVSDPFSIDPCTNPVPADSGNVLITVLPGTGIATPEVESFYLHYDSKNNELVLKNHLAEGSVVELYTINGSLIFQSELPTSGRIKTQTISQGVYFFRVYDDRQEMARGKLLIN